MVHEMLRLVCTCLQARGSCFIFRFPATNRQGCRIGRFDANFVFSFLPLVFPGCLSIGRFLLYRGGRGTASRGSDWGKTWGFITLSGARISRSAQWPITVRVQSTSMAKQINSSVDKAGAGFVRRKVVGTAQIWGRLAIAIKSFN